MSTRAHGTRVKYVVEKCRCEPCRAANAEAARACAKHKARAAFGAAEPLYVDAGPARRHVRGLMSAGIGWHRVARLSGVPTGAVSKLMYGDGPRGMAPSKRIRPETERKLLAVTAESVAVADGVRVDGTGARRRLRALVANGWCQSELARRLGMKPTNFTPLIASDRRMCAGTSRAVAELYEQLWATPPRADDHRSRISVSRAKRQAATRGWVPPLAWDDDTIDDPDANPDLGGAPACGVDPAEVLHLAKGGCSDWEISRRLGIAEKYVQQLKRVAA